MRNVLLLLFLFLNGSVTNAIENIYERSMPSRYTYEDVCEELSSFTKAVHVTFDDNDRSVANELGLSLHDSTITNSKKTFKLYPYIDQLHYELTQRTSDIAKATNIRNAFTSHIFPSNLRIDLKGFLIRFLTNRSIFLGSSDFLFLRSQLKDKVKMAPYSATQKEWHEMESILEKTLQEISENEKDSYPLEAPNRHIMILSSSLGGGHMSAARAIEQFLRSQDYDTSIVDIEDYQQITDPLQYIASYSFKSIFNKIHQQEGNPKKARRYWDFYDKMSYFIPEKSNSVLKEFLSSTNPFLIINTCSYSEKFVSLSYSLEIPQLVITTDFDIWETMDPIIFNGDSKLSKVSLTSPTDKIFQTLRSRYERNKSDFNMEQLLESQTVSLLGYPVNLNIHSLSKIEIEAARRNLGLEKDDSVLLIAMGSQGKPSIYDIVNEVFLSPDLLEKINKIYVIAGRNKHFANNLQMHLEKMNTPDSKKVSILGFINTEEMNILYNISDVIISKPGGSTTAELLKLEKKVVMYDLNLGEWANAQILIDSGLGTLAYTKEDIAPQIEAALTKKVDLKDELKPLDWQKNLLNYVHSIESAVIHEPLPLGYYVPGNH